MNYGEHVGERKRHVANDGEVEIGASVPCKILHDVGAPRCQLGHVALWNWGDTRRPPYVGGAHQCGRRGRKSPQQTRCQREGLNQTYFKKTCMGPSKE